MRGFVGAFVICFNSRAREGASVAWLRRAPWICSIHGAREGRDRVTCWSVTMFRVVSIHAPARGATGGLHLDRARMAFQFHAPRGGANDFEAIEAELQVQFTRPRGARLVRCDLRGVCIVSIHAPARGATLRFFFHPAHNVSIHAAREGARLVLVKAVGNLEFQFTRPRGARHRLG